MIGAEAVRVPLTKLIASAFYGVHHAMKKDRYTHYWLAGGRGSTKSSFASVEIILGMMADPNAHAVALRKIANGLQGSVFKQLLWAINALGVSHLWKKTVSPLKLTYKPTGQEILFSGADDPMKIKSLKAEWGYFKFVWFEEVAEFKGMDDIRTILQTLMRGGPTFTVIYSYNPPASKRNWVNAEALEERPDKLFHHSDYRSVPKEWLGEQFFVEAEHLAKTKPEKYRHEYLGEVIGTGGEIFRNLTNRPITDEEIATFDRIKRGIDFGYGVDPVAYGVMHFDKTRKRLYIFREVYKVQMSNKAISDAIKAENKNNGRITADSAEPRTINELRNLGHNIVGAKKGPDSVEHGVKYLQDLEEIIIDPVRCPNTWREFYGYEHEPDNNGGFKAGYPDKDNHTIDMTRYALEEDARDARVKVIDKKRLGL